MIFRSPRKLEGTILLDEPNAGLAHVARDDPRERAPQIVGELVCGLIAPELERGIEA